jgi:hypothetical protein
MPGESGSDGDPGPPGAPGPAGADGADNFANIEVLDGVYSVSKIVYDAAGTSVLVIGSGFSAGEAVSLTVSGADADDTIGSATANDSGAFAADVTLDSGKYAIGDVKSLVATGDHGSKASTALVVVETK